MPSYSDSDNEFKPETKDNLEQILRKKREEEEEFERLEAVRKQREEERRADYARLDYLRRTGRKEMKP